MTNLYTIRRLKWIEFEDGSQVAQTTASRSYVVWPTDDAKWKAIVYPAAGLSPNEVGGDYVSLAAAKAACWADWKKRIEPALVRVKTKRDAT